MRLKLGKEYYLVHKNKRMHSNKWELGIFAKVVLKKITPQDYAKVDILDLYYEKEEIIPADVVLAFGFQQKEIFEDISSIPGNLKYLIINGVFSK